MDDNDRMRQTVMKQVQDPSRREKNHVKLSKIFVTTQNIKSIQAELVAGYSFDYAKMTEMVNAMFSFINGVVDPNAKVKPAEVKVEEITTHE